MDRQKVPDTSDSGARRRKNTDQQANDDGMDIKNIKVGGEGGNARPTVAPPDPISEEENRFKVKHLGFTVIPKSLAAIFIWGSSKDPDQTLEDFLLTRMTKSLYMKVFDTDQRRKMSDKDVMTLDVTHLFSLIKYGCERLAAPQEPEWNTSDDTRLEWLLTSIKNERNKMCHTEQMFTKEQLLKKTDEIRSLLERALEIAGSLYEKSSADVDEKILQMKTGIISIRDQDLSKIDILGHQNKLIVDHLKNILKTEGRKELKDVYKNWSLLNPVFVMEGQEKHSMEVESVFFHIEVESAGEKKKGTLISFEDLTDFCRDNTSGTDNASSTAIGSNSLPEIFLVEGVGGAGKSTLTKLFMSHWSKGTPDILGLDQFDLLLFVECRNNKAESLADLLSHQLPETNANHFKQDSLRKCALQLRLLVIIDGLDELTSSSERLFKDILETQRTSDLVVLCTSRPEKVKYFHKMVPDEFRKAHLKIRGIPDNLREEFLRRYHDHMKNKGKTVQNTEDLINYYHRSTRRIKDLYRLPLNLVLLAWIWSDDPGRVTSVSTATELYNGILELLQEKHTERVLLNKKAGTVMQLNTEKNVRAYLWTLCQEALEALVMDCLETLPPRSLKVLEDACKANNLPQKETLPLFLTLKPVGDEVHASISHSVFHDLFAAIGIKLKIFHQATRDEYAKVMKDVIIGLNSYHPVAVHDVISAIGRKLDEKLLELKPADIITILSDLHSGKNIDLDLSKYQSVLVQLAGYLYLQKDDEVPECIAQEVVQLLQRSGMGESQYNKEGEDKDWFQVLENTRSNSIIKYVAKEIHGRLNIDDSHVEVAAKLLNYAKPSEVTLDIDSDPWKINGILSLHDAIFQKSLPVNLGFHYNFRHPEIEIDYPYLLESVFGSCDVRGVVGQFDSKSLLILQPSVMDLRLSMATDKQAADLLPALKQIVHKQPNLKLLVVHVGSQISPEAVGPLPRPERKDSRLVLTLSDVGDHTVNRACHMAARLCPSGATHGLDEIRFPRASLGPGKWRYLVDQLVTQEVVFRRLVLPYDPSHQTPDVTETAKYMDVPYTMSYLKEQFLWR